MLDVLKKLSWQERVITLQKYQKEYDLSLRALSEEFNYSIGKLSYELTCASALGEHNADGTLKFPELLKMRSITDATKFLKRKHYHREI